ncbi:unnamed protein product [Allacma fusca]|uniref:Aminotransferase class I/classII large domain-containing protein n=1 Tax=Allacma fusca TaxID=39272 RepID=A0A8J2JK52_9HEXA|nr:unnamed protein product [Allacma fusca]
MTETSSKKDKFALDSKYQGLDWNVWTELGQLYAAEGGVNLGQGFPDYQPAKEIVAELAKVCEAEDYSLHQYARAYGHPRLVKALASLYGGAIGRQIDPWTEILVTGGAYGALFYTVMSNVGRGDEVIIIEPYFDCYEPLVHLAGGKPVFIQLRQTEPGSSSSSTWVLDSEELRGAFNENTKAIIINTPNNPLGKVFSKQELTEIGDLCKKYNVMVISDEVYEWMIYDGNEHVRMASLEGMWERTVTIGSAGKTFSLTGWKLGWAYGPKNLLRNLQVAHENCTYMCHTPEQEAVGAALEHELTLLTSEKSFFRRIREELTRKREFWKNAVLQSGMTPIVPQGGYFMLVDWASLGPKPDLSTEQGYEDVKFVKWLAKNWKLHGIPPSAFLSTRNKNNLGSRCL